MTDQKERAPRFEIQQMVQVNLGREEFIAAEGVNISESGMLCETDEPVDPGTRVFLMIGVPDAPPEKVVTIAEAMVVRSEEIEGGYLQGVKFDYLHQDQLERLREFLASNPAE